MSTFSPSGIFRVLCGLVVLTATAGAQEERVVRSIRSNFDGTVTIDSGWKTTTRPNQTPRIFNVEASIDLENWSRAGTVHHWPFDYHTRPEGSPLFYRVSDRVRRSSDDWKNVVVIPTVVTDSSGDERWIDEPFFAFPLGGFGGGPYWMKFAILLNEPGQPVVFQDSRKYVFHYEFARARLDGFAGMSRSKFDAISLFPGPDQRVVLGAVLRSPVQNSSEIGVQFVGATPYDLADVSDWFHKVSGAVNSMSVPLESYYMPVFEQSALSEEDLATLGQSGVPVSSPDRWSPGNGIYSDGWAVGRLVFVESANIDTAFATGELLPTDILFTDGIPAEIPLVAGIVSLTPATPNSHVAILARSFGIPFAYVRNPVHRENLVNSAGSEIYLAASALEFAFNNGDGNVLRILPLGEGFPQELKAALLDLKNLGKLDFAPKISAGTLSASTDELTPDDINRFGGKASNYGFLRRTISSASREAVAFSFDLWDGFLQRDQNGGGTLGKAIADKLEPFRSWPVADMAGLDVALAEVRDLIKDGTFSEENKAAVIAALEPFDPNRKIRFRSSTNVEDSDSFVGAGLYDSFSGCLADDTDGDEVGPSACDPTRDNERGVFRAIRKVFASFYNRNAYIERLRFGVDESQVGMAMLVHHSFPDETELANGVAVVKESFGDRWSAEIVTQLGAVSVANPDGNATPEIVTASGNLSAAPFITLTQGSALVTTGDHVMNWESDYRALTRHLFRVYYAVRKTLPNPDGLELDFEFKKIQEEGLVIKQVRRIPPSSSTKVAPFLLNTPETFATFQGETFDGFYATHRMKSKWTVRVASRQLDRAGRRQPLIESVRIEYLDGKETMVLDSPVVDLPGYRHSFEGNTSTESWNMQIDGEAVRWSVTLQNIPEDKSVATDVAITLQDLRVSVTADYPSPRPEFVWDNQRGEVVLGTTNKDRMTLGVDRMDAPLTPRSALQSRSVAQNGVSIETKLFWPPPPVGATAGYTAPAEQWDETVIEGLTDQPISLKGFWSQTYLPGHHNFSETFFFQPQLESGIPQATLNELEAQNVDLIIVEFGLFGGPTISYIGLDGKRRSRL